MNEIKFAFDIDGVVCDTMDLFFKILRKEYHITSFHQDQLTSYMIEDCIPLKNSIITEIIQRINYGEIDGYKLKPIKDSIEVLKKYNKKIKEPLIFVTARPVEKFINGWLVENLDNDVRVIAIGSFDKNKIMMEEKIRYFVDDRVETCISIIEQTNTIPIVFDQTWNRYCGNDLLRAYGWKDLEKVLLKEK